MTDQRYLHCLYAEDVRPEVSGTFSIIGAFQGGIQLQTIPATLPKLAVIATLSFAAHDHFKAIRIEVKLNDKVLQTIEPPSDFIEQSLQGAKVHAEETNGQGFFLQLMVTIIGVQIDEPGRISTRAYVDDELWTGNGLVVKGPPNAP